MDYVGDSPRREREDRRMEIALSDAWDCMEGS